MGLQALQSLSAGGRQKEKADRARETALDHEALVWVLSALSQLFCMLFDPKLVVGQRLSPYGFDTVARAADSLGLRAGWKNLPASGLKKLGAPFVVTLLPIFREPRQSNFDTSPDPGVPNARPAFVLRIDEGRVAFFKQARRAYHPAAGRVRVALCRDGTAGGTESRLPDPDAKSAAHAHFGFRWFLPELLKAPQGRSAWVRKCRKWGHTGNGARNAGNGVQGMGPGNAGNGVPRNGGQGMGVRPA